MSLRNADQFNADTRGSLMACMSDCYLHSDENGTNNFNDNLLTINFSVNNFREHSGQLHCTHATTGCSRTNCQYNAQMEKLQGVGLNAKPQRINGPRGTIPQNARGYLTTLMMCL